MKKPSPALALAPDRANDDIGEEKRLELYRTQFELREAEQRAYDLFLQNLVKGTSHLSLGQEAVAAGFAGAMKPGDSQLLHLSRPRPYAGARRAGREGAGRADAARQRPDARQGRLDASDLGRARRDGLLRHHRRASADRLRRRLARAVQGRNDVSVCFFGDGTTNIGAFHEALNFAAVWKLPVVFVCENNLYMEYTPIGDVTAVEHPAADRAAAYGLERIVIDGNDADAVYRTARTAYARARAGEGPSLIECMTYRHSGHSRADPAKYRPEGELDELEEARSDQDLSRAAAAVRHRRGRRSRRSRPTCGASVDEATEACKAAPPPPLDILTTDVYADGGWAWRN